MTDTTNNKPAVASDEFSGTVRTIIMAILIAVLIRMFAFEPFSIPSSSMVPGLLVGDFLFVSKFSYGYSSRSTMMGTMPIPGRIFFKMPERGDVAVFKLPSDNSTDYIKRVIGLPGDMVEMRHGLLYINGAPVQREKLAQPTAQEYISFDETVTDYIETLPNGKTHVIRKNGEDMPLDNTTSFIVPPHHYFMMGDNRDNSQDSRTKRVGFVPEENLVGKAEFLFFSIDEGTHFIEFWKWPTSVRWKRLFKKIS
ncbi:MAG: signal peptidase I [Alphaproteobacteria bacterium]|nr:signal peptidase I [Alphaproteobacteria bacterium]